VALDNPSKHFEGHTFVNGSEYLVALKHAVYQIAALMYGVDHEETKRYT
jgi:hypothetical protein